MTTLKLPCLKGGECKFETLDLNYTQAKEQQDGHMRYAHPVVGHCDGDKGKKPEKFPRPEVKLDSTAEVWEDFKACWDQYIKSTTCRARPWSDSCTRAARRT